MAGTPDGWRRLANQLRADSIRSTTEAGSGHPTSSLSAADLMAVLLSDHLHYDWKTPRSPDNDRLVFSKGHAAPLLYSMFKAAGAITDAELLSLRKLGSRIEGHPTPLLPWVDVPTGSLGQGLPTAIGMALAARLLGRDIRCWVLLGDSEMAEGSVYEAFELAGFYGLNQVVAIVDMNRLGQRGPTMVQWDGEQYASRARAFGWHALLLDGHDPADHWPQGGLGDAVCEVFAGRSDPPSIKRLAVRGMPGSGTPRQLLDAAGISTRHIVEAVRRIPPPPVDDRAPHATGRPPDGAARKPAP